MKENINLNRLYILGLLILVSYPPNRGQAVIAPTCLNSKSHDNFTKAEIYCWCFLEAPSKKYQDSLIETPTRNCTTTFTLKASDIVKKKFLYDTIKSKKVLTKLVSCIFKNYQKKEELSLPVDTRFVMLFYKENSPPDTVAFYRSTELIINNKKYIYSFSIIDSIRTILGKKEISCNS